MTARSPARARRPVALLVAVALSAASPLRASADTAESVGDVESARALFVEGSKLARQGRWEEARALYTRSLQIKPAALTWYSLGVAQKETGRLVDALASFRTFLAEPTTTTTAPYVRPARSAVAALEQHIGRVTIAVHPGNIEGLTLAIDGAPLRGAPDHAVEVDPGAHEIVASAPGFRPVAARFRVDGGRSVEVPITFAAETAETAAAPADPPKGGLPPVADTGPAPPSRTLPIVMMGTGGALFAGGVVLGLSGLSQASGATTRGGPEARSAQTKGIVGDVLGGVGVATVGVGLYLLLKQPAPSPPRSGAVTPWIGASGAGVELRL
ncbi:hypothetical protein SOCE26_081780 [Sorangium cellulosum]|uniref:Uncharacterized protein n=1 Tax=Sorangium cellulosum TaxID=56 RepID=A0A2L0F594_SORCE|nr:tetratricopeptide repeat protein [Sorangium cellulosum]AUX46671.1 hypothetical protein SOCE26_081780 [Sorangium cellulosum]